MASIKFGLINSKPGMRIVSYPIAATQYFAHDGVNAVKLDGNGRVILALTADTSLDGIAIVPEGRGVGTSDVYWLSSSVAGSDKIRVVTDNDARYLLPANRAAVDSDVGNQVDLISVNDGSQTQVNLDVSVTDLFVVEKKGIDVGGPAASVVVKINESKLGG